MDIEVTEKDRDNFIVKVTTDTETEHQVFLDDEYWKELTDGKVTKQDLIKKSFAFLLDRESNTRILPHFDLKLISEFFREFEDEIK